MAYYKSGGINVTSNSNVSINTASGSIASFNTNLSMPVLETKATINPIQNGTPWIDSNEVNKEPYIKRAVAGTATRIGNHLYDKLVGGTVAFNQMINNGNFANNTVWSAIRCTLTASNNVGTIAKTDNKPYVEERFNFTAGHKYLYIASLKPAENATLRLEAFYDNEAHTTGINYTVSAWATLAFIIAPVTTDTGDKGRFRIGLLVGDTGEIKNCNLFDLTAMFGSTIADYIYSLEQATAGSGVNFFRKLFPKPYYAYNAGELISVKTSAHITRGFNAWDEIAELGTIDDTTGQNDNGNTRLRSKNYIPCLPNTIYYVKKDGGGNIRFFFYDANKNFISSFGWIAGNTTLSIPDNTYFIRFILATQYGTTYNNDICINLHWDGERDGEYEPYVEHEYPLDSDLELRGIPKLDANNKLYYDGDTYESDGTVTRKYGIVDLGSFSWTFYSPWGFMSGTSISDIKLPSSDNDPIIGLCDRYMIVTANGVFARVYDNIIAVRPSGRVCIYDNGKSSYTPAQFKTAMDGVYLVYELAEPTTETADEYQNPQIVDDFGTEEYVDNRTVPMPVGHETYQANICPISGFDELNVMRTGANIWDEEWEVGGLNAITGQAETNNTRIRSTGFCPCLPAMAYYGYIGTASVSLLIYWYDSTKGFIKRDDITNDTVTSPINAHFFKVMTYDNLTPHYTDYKHDISINSPSSDTQYHAHSGKLIKLEFDDTVYLAEVSCLNGVWKLKLLGAEVDLGDLTWVYRGPQFPNIFSSTGITNYKYADTIDALCSHLQFGGMCVGVAAIENDHSVYFYYTRGSSERVVYVKDTRYSDAVSFKAAMSGVKLVYPLETPTEITIDETEQFESLIGVNNVWHDGNGDTEVKYRKVNI